MEITRKSPKTLVLSVAILALFGGMFVAEANYTPATPQASVSELHIDDTVTPATITEDVATKSASGEKSSAVLAEPVASDSKPSVSYKPTEGVVVTPVAPELSASSPLVVRAKSFTNGLFPSSTFAARTAPTATSGSASTAAPQERNYAPLASTPAPAPAEEGKVSDGGPVAPEEPKVSDGGPTAPEEPKVSDGGPVAPEPELNEPPRGEEISEGGPVAPAPEEPKVSDGGPTAPEPELNEPPRGEEISEGGPVAPAPPVVDEAPSYYQIDFSDNTSPEVKAAWAGDYSQIAKFEGNPSSSISHTVIDENTRIVKWSAGNYRAEATLKSHDVAAFQSSYIEFTNKVLSAMKPAPAPIDEAAYVTIEFLEGTSPEVKTAWAGDFSQIAKFEGNPSSSTSVQVIDKNTRIVSWSAGDYVAKAKIASNDVEAFHANYIEFTNKVLGAMK